MVLGLTGSIGMGKSATAQMFRHRGIVVHDSDAAVHRLYAGPAAALVEARFPGTTKDGVVDRAGLGGRVLRDSAAMRDLEAIIHPLVEADRDAFLAAARLRNDKCVLLDIPLLFESGGDASVDLVIVVSAPFAVQSLRVLARAGMTPERFSQIVQRQMPDAAKRSRAHWVIATDSGLADADRQVAGLLRAIAAV